MKITLQNIYKEIDNIVSNITVDYPGLVKCKIGCSDCCHAVFDVSLIEGQLILEAFRALERAKRREITRKAEKALKQWQNIVNQPDRISDIGRERIRCPLLDKNNICSLYDARPVNCRTYGIPLEIDGKSRVCGLSGFKQGENYPAFNLSKIHQRLMALSLELSKDKGMKRWPIASVILSA